MKKINLHKFIDALEAIAIGAFSVIGLILFCKYMALVITAFVVHF